MIIKTETQSSLVSMAEAATILGCSKRTIKRRINAGELAAKKDGRRLKVLRWSLDGYIAGLPDARGVRS